MINFTRMILLVAFGALLVASPQARAQEQFRTADDAVNALVGAARSQDKDAIVGVLGRQGKHIVTSGDPVADEAVRTKFLAAYDAKHALKEVGDSATLVIGNDDWPFPIPIVRRNDLWSFDTKAGLAEILQRRIGRNELSAIQASLAYVQAQQEYAALDPQGFGPHVYAMQIVSSDGKKDGLYWPAAEGQPESPLGDLFAEAAAEGYHPGATPIPYHGYYYRILTRQGPDAKGGAFDYVVNGKMIGGFALLAYPAEYGNSGIMTFMVSHDGDVFQRDLGPRTAKIVRSIQAFSPDAGWKKVEADATQ
jgi:hypothetical protein